MEKARPFSFRIVALPAHKALYTFPLRFGCAVSMRISGDRPCLLPLFFMRLLRSARPHPGVSSPPSFRAAVAALSAKGIYKARPAPFFRLSAHSSRNAVPLHILWFFHILSTLDDFLPFHIPVRATCSLRGNRPPAAAANRKYPFPEIPFLR